MIEGNEALVLTKGTLSTVKFTDAHLIALACESTLEEKMFLADCEHTIAQFTDLFGAEKFVCPSNCSTGNV